MSDKFPLSTIRHSASHVLAQAVLHKFPEAKLAIGPAIDEGFYYDFDLEHTLTPEDLKDIEKEMKRIIKEKQEFKMYSLSSDEARTKLEEQKQPLKVEIIEDLNKTEYSFYQNGPFEDLCRGPHVNHTGQVGAVKLLKVSGAYWRGDENNKMLQRIYGTAFHDREALKEHLTKLEEAQKRDHRVLGKALDLFSIQEAIGPGLILWHPNGSRMRHIIETFWKESHFKAGYELIYTPHVGRAKLWETSGHLSFYDENMYASMDVDNQSYYVKPMNCPFHIMWYKTKRWSYRDMPLRLAELGTVYRYERSGVLHGLMRVRGFTQDDAHIFCTKEQASDEIKDVVQLCLDVLRMFDFKTYEIFLSTKPKEKSVGEKEDWDQAEDALRNALEEMKLPFEIDEGGGAFYGPKIDIKIKDAIGRYWQCSTVQFDFNLPQRFDLSYTGSDGKLHQPFMIHRALFGSIERFFGILIEHFAGKFPLWLSPVQVKILAVNDTVHTYCKELNEQLKANQIRSVVDVSSEKLGYKIRQAQKEQVNYMLVIGNKEQDEGVVSVRSRDQGELGKMTVDELKTHLNQELSQGQTV